MTVPVEYPAPCKYGHRVRFWKHGTAGSNQPDARTGEGTFTLHWLGIEECWNVTLDSGEVVGLIPCLGDTMEPMAPAPREEEGVSDA